MKLSPREGLDKTAPGAMKRALVVPGFTLAAGRIAQLVEQLTLNQRVQGSNPCAPTNEINVLWDRNGFPWCDAVWRGHGNAFAGFLCAMDPVAPPLLGLASRSIPPPRPSSAKRVLG